MSDEFKNTYGPVALVTGASSGIGEAFAEALARKGMDLVLVARRIDRLEALGNRLTDAYRIKTQSVQVDLSQPDAADQMLAATAASDVGLLVSNAGFSMKGEHAANDPSVMSEMLAVNCHVPLQLTRGIIPRLRERRARGAGAGIILTSSIEALMGCPYSTAYSATKALVKSLGEGLWGELHPEGIDVLTLCPGATETEALAKSGVDVTKMQNTMSADEVAELTLDNIANGPTFFSSKHYVAMFEQLLSLPRRDALTAMAAALKRASASQA